jgi:hypothetical protein
LAIGLHGALRFYGGLHFTSLDLPVECYATRGIPVPQLLCMINGTMTEAIPAAVAA